MRNGRVHFWVLNFKRNTSNNQLVSVRIVVLLCKREKAGEMSPGTWIYLFWCRVLSVYSFGECESIWQKGLIKDRLIRLSLGVRKGLAQKETRVSGSSCTEGGHGGLDSFDNMFDNVSQGSEIVR